MSVNNVDPLRTEDAEIVKTRLENLRERKNRSMIHSRGDLNESLS